MGNGEHRSTGGSYADTQTPLRLTLPSPEGGCLGWLGVSCSHAHLHQWGATRCCEAAPLTWLTSVAACSSCSAASTTSALVEWRGS